MLPHKLDKIEDSDNLGSIEDILSDDYPSECIDDHDLFNSHQINQIAKLLLKALQVRVLNAEYFDIIKFVFNFYGKHKFINPDFIDLVGSVIDYLEVNYNLLNPKTNIDHTVLLEAVNSTIDAACVLVSKRYPLINQILSKNAKSNIEQMKTNTIKRINKYDSNSYTNLPFGNTTMNFNEMFKTMMVMDAMKKNDFFTASMLMNSGKKKVKPDKEPVEKKEKKNDFFSKMMEQQMQQQMMGNMGGMMGMVNPMMGMGGMMNPMMGNMGSMMGMGNMMGGMGGMANLMMNMDPKQMQQMQMMEMMNNMFKKKKKETFSVNPNMADIYNDPDLMGQHGVNSHESEMLDKMNNDAKMQEMLANFHKMGKEIAESYDDGEDELDVSIDCTGEDGAWWLEDSDDEHYNRVDFDDELANGIYDVFNTMEDDDNYIEKPALSAEEVMRMEFEKDKQEILDKWFGGVKPEGTIEKEFNGIPYYAFTPEGLFSGSYKTTESVNYYFNNGEIPPASASSLPLTIRGKNKVYSILFIDGQRFDVIVPDTGVKVDINDHIPPAAVVVWDKLKKDIIVDENGNAINSDNVFIVDDEFVGTRNSVSITANAYALATEEIELGNKNNRPIEYIVNDPIGFHSENADEILKLFGEDKTIDNINGFVKSVNENESLDIGIKAYIDQKGTKVINDFLLYSLIIDVKIDSFLEDYPSLEKHLEEKGGSHYVDYLRRAQKQLSQAICNAISGEEIDSISNITGEYEKVEIVEGKEVKSIVQFDSDSFNDKLVIFNNRTQVTELPWVYEDLGINLVRQHENADPFVLLTKTEYNEDQYDALKEVLNRSMVDGVIRETEIVTKDRIVLSIVQSAYDENSFIIVGRGY